MNTKTRIRTGQTLMASQTPMNRTPTAKPLRMDNRIRMERIPTERIRTRRPTTTARLPPFES